MEVGIVLNTDRLGREREAFCCWSGKQSEDEQCAAPVQGQFCVPVPAQAPGIVKGVWLLRVVCSADA